MSNIVMPTYLLTWNPDSHPTVPDLTGLRPGSSGTWSCGNRKSMPEGSRVFLLRQGVDPRGIVASGHTTSDVYLDRHWDPKKRRAGKKANYVHVRFDVVKPNPPDLLPRASLTGGTLGTVHWDTPASGEEIPAAVARVLERRWRLASQGKAAIPAGASRPRNQKGNTRLENDLRDSLENRRETAQGFQADPMIRKVVEKLALKQAKRHYEKKGFRVTVKGKPYDLKCQTARNCLYVEVKGTQTTGDKCTLTPKEVDFARKHDMELFVLHSVHIGGKRKHPLASGGKAHVVSRWRPLPAQLRVVLYECTI